MNTLEAIRALDPVFHDRDPHIPRFKSVLKLSEREYQVFLLLGEGLRLADIAARYGICTKTVATHMERIGQKTEQPHFFALRAFASRFLERMGRPNIDRSYSHEPCFWWPVERKQTPAQQTTSAA